MTSGGNEKKKSSTKSNKNSKDQVLFEVPSDSDEDISKASTRSKKSNGKKSKNDSGSNKKGAKRSR